MGRGRVTQNLSYVRVQFNCRYIFRVFHEMAARCTGYKVYTLLMNVDYIPILKEYIFPAWVEFMFHLIIAVILAYVIVWVAWKKHYTRKQLIRFTIVVNIIIAIALYPTTALSDRTPALFSFPSFGLWLVAHIAYGIVLGVLLARLLPLRLNEGDIKKQ